MPQDWKFSTGSAAFEEWWRSGQQLIQVPPGGVPEMNAPITIIRKYDNGDVVTLEGQAVNIRMDELTFIRDIEDAFAIQGAMFRMLARRVDPMSLPEEERFPAPPSTDSPSLPEDCGNTGVDDSGETGDGVIVQP